MRDKLAAAGAEVGAHMAMDGMGWDGRSESK